ncbi:MAG TPA: TetR family transcriptional regulator [Candidatus Dormibacteraeota bacterium]
MAPGKREAILTAALPLLTEGGDFSLEALLRRAGAGVGTFYHHFPNGREDLLAALQAQALAEYEESILRVLRRNRAAEPAVRALVHHQLRWTAENAAAASLVAGSAQPPSRDLLREVRTWAETAGLTAAPPDLLLAAALGPVRDWTRAGQRAGLESAADRLAAASWAAVLALA